MIIDQAVIIQGEAKKEENSVKILAENIVPIDLAEETWAASININVNVEKTDKDIFPQLKNILKKQPGSSKVIVNLLIPGKSVTQLELQDDYKLKVDKPLIREINAFLGYNAVETTCTEIKLAPKKNGYRKKR